MMSAAIPSAMLGAALTVYTSISYDGTRSGLNKSLLSALAKPANPPTHQPTRQPTHPNPTKVAVFFISDRSQPLSFSF